MRTAVPGRLCAWALTVDPWGHRYAVNIRAMTEDHADTLVLSAGPDGIVESDYARDGLHPGGDDILALVASSGAGW